jgi:hypothetical protein
MNHMIDGIVVCLYNVKAFVCLSSLRWIGLNTATLSSLVDGVATNRAFKIEKSPHNPTKIVLFSKVHENSTPGRRRFHSKITPKRLNQINSCPNIP